MEIAKKIRSNPKKLFLIDAFGALLSAFLLGVLLVEFESVFGIPRSTLYLLAIIPVFFAIYDFYSYRNANNKLRLFLRGIAVMNLLYCCLSFGFALYHKEQITLIGWTYILLEILIIVILAIFELRIASNHLQSPL